MKLSLWSSLLGLLVQVNGKWGSCPQEPGLRAASIVLRSRESQRGWEGKKEVETEKGGERERQRDGEKQGQRWE